MASANDGALCGGDLEFLKIDGVVSMSPAVDHVEAGHGEHGSVVAAQIGVERNTCCVCRGPGGGHRDTEDRVRSEACLVGGAVELDESCVETGLVGDVEARQRVVDFGSDVRDRLPYSFAPVATRVAVAQSRLPPVHRSRLPTGPSLRPWCRSRGGSGR